MLVTTNSDAIKIMENFQDSTQILSKKLKVNPIFNRFDNDKKLFREI